MAVCTPGCPSCYEHRPMAEHLRGRCFATTRFRCTNIRYTGDVCGCTGSVEIEPTVLLPVGGKNYLAFSFCRSCQPSWEINHVLIDQPPWSVAKRVRGDRFKCPGCHRAVAWRIHGPTWRPTASHGAAANHTDRREAVRATLELLTSADCLEGCFERAVRINRCPGGVDTVTCRVDRQYHDMRPTKRTVSQVG